MSKFSDDDLEAFSRIGEIARLTALLAERDAEITRIRNAFGDKSKENSVLKGALHSAGKAFSRENYHVLTQSELDRKLLDYTALLSAKLTASQQQVAELQLEIDRLKLIEVVYRAIINNTHIAEDERLAKIIELTEQLAASQQECERLSSVLGLREYTNHTRKQAAREIVEMLRSDKWAESELKDIIEKFGLEG